ncbi:MAG: 3-deoxy-8-phosphooctulonate synthase [bacterium]|nr:3-deoxy-8-phosphooctulonate synthase [bacterium]
MKKITDELHIPYIYKSSYAKANRQSIDSYAGPGIESGLKILARVKRDLDVPILTDIHSPQEAAIVAEVADVLQIPAFLCRQTDIVVAAAKTGKPVNIKKGQFMAPEDMGPIAAKAANSGNDQIILTERGSTFGYHNLVVDFRSLVIMKNLGYPVVFDATHSLQLPGAGKGHSGGQPQFIFPMAKAAIAVGVQAIFLETHPCVEQALCDAANMLPLQRLRELLIQLKDIDSLTKHSSN